MHEGMRLFGDFMEAENDKIQLSNIFKTVLDAELGRNSILDTLDGKQNRRSFLYHLSPAG